MDAGRASRLVHVGLQNRQTGSSNGPARHVETRFDITRIGQTGRSGNCWNRLNLVIAHSTEPFLWIQNIHQSPFNVGNAIRLDDFDFNQVSELNVRHGAPLKTEDEVKQLMDLIGAQPYLVRQALYTLVTKRWGMTQLEKVAAEETGPFSDHLRRHIWLLQANQELKRTMQQILHNGACDEELHFERLRAAGLVQGTTRHAVHMRCKLYKIYFSRHL
jgi:hypothetical protein